MSDTIVIYVLMDVQSNANQLVVSGCLSFRQFMTFVSGISNIQGACEPDRSQGSSLLIIPLFTTIYISGSTSS